ncbi:PREDICTED: pentatricopeptide repeat-containing protein At1g08070, chloroplastic [Theobroma cacao]|uniref:Pentatricopeptide repeat-containing protein At1g08070, chloroplastic n=1 Tax=Theobroma cacao TaxID=3641 RepID=A0AB32URG2_THECC|nr:PREDICTED: pentatricopeptide repeat-containing protein At1g08070, chloroplastic [Theobroma cacao]
MLKLPSILSRMQKPFIFSSANIINYTNTPPKIPHSNYINNPFDTLELCQSTEQFKQLHALTIKTRPLQTQLLYSKILSSLSPLSSPESLNYARELLSHLKAPYLQVHFHNSIIQALSNSLEAMALYREMITKGIYPDTYTIPYVLKACAKFHALEEGQQVHAHSIKFNLNSNVYVLNTLMRLYAVCGIIDNVRNLFDQSPERDLVSWTTIIQAFVKTGFAKEAIQAYFDMCRENLRPDKMTLVVVLSACSRLGDLSLGTQIHENICNFHDIGSDVFVDNALVDMYMKCGDVDSARQLFNLMPVKNVVSWNSMISGLVQQGQFKEALDVFHDMQKIGLKPDNVTLVAVLNACGNLGKLEFGKWVHAYVDKNRIKADGFIGNALVDMYAKCGSVEQAFGVFHSMKCRDVFSYTAMIVGFAMNGEAERALEIFAEMPVVGVKPDDVTFVGVLSACSHAGLVEEGWKHFEDMSRVYNLQPQTEHYGCMVDLLGRAGLISEAEEFIANMPIEPDAFVWGALLGACSIHGKVELGESVMEKLVDIEPVRDGAYILMSNIYSSANRWKDALKLRKAMKERKLKKTPGCSLIEVNGIVYEFRKGDKSHPRNEELRKLLEEMATHLQSHGQFPSSNCIS